MVCNTDPRNSRHYSSPLIFPLWFCLHTPDHKPVFNSLMLIPCLWGSFWVHWILSGVSLCCWLLSREWSFGGLSTTKPKVLCYTIGALPTPTNCSCAQLPLFNTWKPFSFKAVWHLSVFSPSHLTSACLLQSDHKHFPSHTCLLLFLCAFCIFFAELLRKLSSFSPACPKLSSALSICSPSLLNLSHIGSADRHLNKEHFKSNVLLLWII